MKQVLIFGGTGFIGRSLAKHLKERDFSPVLLGRNKPKEEIEFQFRKWDAISVGDWVELLSESVAVVNLAGRTVDCIKTPENCDVILKSRVNATRAIGEAYKLVDKYPPVWVQMSTAHIYGDPPSEVCNEESSTGYGLAPFVGKAWEQAFHMAKPKDVRGVILRTSFVVGRNGGALKSLSNIVRLGLGGTVGSGKQGMSWIHEYDMNEIIHQSIINKAYEGIIIATAPNPVSNKEFMKTLRKKMRMPIGLPAPAFLTRIGAKLIFKTDPELALYGRYVVSKKLEKLNYKFEHPMLDQALENLLRS